MGKRELQTHWSAQNFTGMGHLGPESKWNWATPRASTEDEHLLVRKGWVVREARNYCRFSIEITIQQWETPTDTTVICLCTFCWLLISSLLFPWKRWHVLFTWRWEEELSEFLPSSAIYTIFISSQMLWDSQREYLCSACTPQIRITQRYVLICRANSLVQVSGLQALSILL